MGEGGREIKVKSVLPTDLKSGDYYSAFRGMIYSFKETRRVRGGGWGVGGCAIKRSPFLEYVRFISGE